MASCSSFSLVKLPPELTKPTNHTNLDPRLGGLFGCVMKFDRCLFFFMRNFTCGVAQLLRCLQVSIPIFSLCDHPLIPLSAACVCLALPHFTTDFDHDLPDVPPFPDHVRSIRSDSPLSPACEDPSFDEGCFFFLPPNFLLYLDECCSHSDQSLDQYLRTLRC